MRSSGVIKVLYVVRKASQYKTRSAEQKKEEREDVCVEFRGQSKIDFQRKLLKT